MTTPRALAPRAAAVLADRGEAAAFRDLYAAAPSRLQDELGLEVHEHAGATALVARSVPTSMFNRVIGLGLSTAAAADDLEALAAIYRNAGVPDWWLHWSPYAEPHGFTAVLATHGYEPAQRRAWAKLLRPSVDPPAAATSLELRAVGGTAEAEAVGAAIAGAFEMPASLGAWISHLHARPGWELFGLYDGEAPVGGGALFHEGEACWLGMGAVLPSHRRRGGQSALVARRIAWAEEHGVPWVVTETGLPISDEPNPSLANLRRAGFRCVAERENLRAPSLAGR